MRPEIRDEVIGHELQNDMVEHLGVIKEDSPAVFYHIITV
jgi:hypothetical protein